MMAADTDHLEESALVSAMKAGDDVAYERAVRMYAGRLLAVARRMLHNEDEARDVVQDALLSAFRSIDSFKGDSRLSTWLHRILVNAALMRIRAKRRRPEVSIEEILPVFDSNGEINHSGMPWRKGGADGAAIDDETRSVIYEAMARLPDDYRNVLLLRDIEDLSTRETAEALGDSEGAVKIRLHRARLALRQLLEPHFSGDDRE